MTDISALTGSLTGQPANSQQGLADNFEMFLTLLTEQMKNQDPLDPLDSTQFVNQLVDFSSVEQQIRQNQNLENLLTLQAASSQSASVSYIGRVATAETPQTELTGGQANWQYVMPRDASATTLIVKDEAGRPVATFAGQTGTGTQTFAWDGLDNNGAVMPDGIYSLEAVSRDIEGDEIIPTIQASARVTGVDLSGDEVLIEMGAVRVPLTSVRSLRDGSAA